MIYDYGCGNELKNQMWRFKSGCGDAVCVEVDSLGLRRWSEKIKIAAHACRGSRGSRDVVASLIWGNSATYLLT